MDIRAEELMESVLAQNIEQLEIPHIPNPLYSYYPISYLMQVNCPAFVLFLFSL